MVARRGPLLNKYKDDLMKHTNKLNNNQGERNDIIKSTIILSVVGISLLLCGILSIL